MERTIISHDIQAGTARVCFEHNGVTHEQDYSLIDVIPSSRYVFEAMGITFDESYQLMALDKLETMVLHDIEAGLIQNPPEPETPPEPQTPDPEEGEPVEGEE